ncbi:hypothetical protein TNIN_425641 [Trichonephila inaurata madagascariensis]|uniref:Uncharacterized protein n=1 Tax=Trichonephila inaurata madagascariensis TaxID=2747483 RepID=A0A8X6YPM3_9ARAC|nr:hypothetical protein TNIN_425641 [Trichonephila inaurata madagascariensis]
MVNKKKKSHSPRSRTYLISLCYFLYKALPQYKRPVFLVSQLRMLERCASSGKGGFLLFSKIDAFLSMRRRGLGEKECFCGALNEPLHCDECLLSLCPFCVP